MNGGKKLSLSILLYRRRGEKNPMAMLNPAASSYLIHNTRNTWSVMDRRIRRGSVMIPGE